MKARLLILALAGMSLSLIPAYSQGIREEVYSDLNKAGGVYYMYPFRTHLQGP